MDYQNVPERNPENNNYQYQPQDSNSRYNSKHSQGFATASLVMGILSIVSGCCVYSALPLGALAIIFALLSRGGEMKLDAKGTVGLWLGISGVIITITVTIFLLVYTINFYGGIDEFMKYYNELTEQYMQYYQLQ